jgi:serine/threonine-protein kinase
MDANRWTRLRDLYHQVEALPPDERDAALIAACGDDAALLADARALFSREIADGAGAVVDGIVAAAVAGLDDEGPPADRVGPYRLVREIGQGGMGAVYLAERADGQFEQRVALKLIKPGLATAQFLERFRAERQILARLQHPNIARLLDGGIDDEGRPYFALEYVEGEPIDRYSATRAASVDERLRLFLQVCRAVSYAHANLVVHRDLKPAHVMVTPDGQVRLLDFGIAKVVSDEVDGTGRTQFGIRAMTPAYASPEQVRGDAVGTGTDVYSLGVILYELLTGVPPYEFDGQSPAEIERVVCGTEPQRPSTRIGGSRTSSGAEGGHGPSAADVARARKRLRGDLDVICLKALQKDPERRYQSVEALQDDLRRNLDGLPVLARPDSVPYRLNRFAARHRVGLGVAAVVAFAFAVFLAYHTMRLSDERDLAQLEAAKAEQVATFLRGLFEVSDPSISRGETVTARELLDEGATRIERELAGQPDVRASMMLVIGQVYHALGLFDAARPHLEQTLAEHRRLYGDAHEDVAMSAAALASVLQDMGDVEAAEPLFREALATRRAVFGEPDPRVSESLAALAFLLETRGDPEGAERLAREVLAMNRALHPPDHPLVAEATADLAGYLRRQGRYDDAAPLLRAALAAQRAHFGDQDLTVASTARNLASLLRDRGALDEAASLYEEVIATRRAILGDDHPDVGGALNSHALLLLRQGDAGGAIAALRAFLDIVARRHAGRPHPDLAVGYYNLATAYRDSGQLDEAAATHTRGMEISDQVYADDHPNRAYPRIGLGRVYMDQGRFDLAEPLLRESVAIRRLGLTPGHRYTGDALLELGTCLMRLRRFAEAEVLMLEAEALFRDGLGDDDDRTRRARRRLDELDEAWRPRAPSGR